MTGLGLPKVSINPTGDIMLQSMLGRGRLGLAMKDSHLESRGVTVVLSLEVCLLDIAFVKITLTERMATNIIGNHGKNWTGMDNHENKVSSSSLTGRSPYVS